MCCYFRVLYDVQPVVGMFNFNVIPFAIKLFGFNGRFAPGEMTDINRGQLLVYKRCILS